MQEINQHIDAMGQPIDATITSAIDVSARKNSDTVCWAWIIYLTVMHHIASNCQAFCDYPFHFLLEAGRPAWSPPISGRRRSWCFHILVFTDRGHDFRPVEGPEKSSPDLYERKQDGIREIVHLWS